MKRTEWEQLAATDKTKYLRGIEARIPRAQFRGLADFDAIKTGQFDIDGATFVYVPAASATVGFDAMSAIPQGFLELLFKEMVIAGMDVENESDPLAVARAELLTMMAPRRSVYCRELLVEQYFAEPIMSSDHSGSKFPFPPWTVIKYAGDDQQTRTQIVATMRDQGWDILTEDEWEYLALGHYETLLPPAGMRLLASDPAAVRSNSMSTVDPFDSDNQWRPGPGELLDPARFGRFVPSQPNPYGLWLNSGGPQELVNSECLIRNGDGASASCGGYASYDVLAASPHFRFIGAWLEFFCIRRVIDLTRLSH